jgi:hypothetical protein
MNGEMVQQNIHKIYINNYINFDSEF